MHIVAFPSASQVSLVYPCRNPKVRACTCASIMYAHALQQYSVGLASSACRAVILGEQCLSDSLLCMRLLCWPTSYNFTRTCLLCTVPYFITKQGPAKLSDQGLSMQCQEHVPSLKEETCRAVMGSYDETFLPHVYCRGPLVPLLDTATHGSTAPIACWSNTHPIVANRSKWAKPLMPAVSSTAIVPPCYFCDILSCKAFDTFDMACMYQKV